MRCKRCIKNCLDEERQRPGFDHTFSVTKAGHRGLTGAAGGFKDDVEIRLANQTLRLESKVRKNGFSLIYHWLGTADR
jgi:hypothetical protein